MHIPHHTTHMRATFCHKTFCAIPGMHSRAFLVSWRDLDAIWFLTKFLFAEKYVVCNGWSTCWKDWMTNQVFVACLGLSFKQIVSTGRGWPTSGDTFGWPGWANSSSVFSSHNGPIKIAIAKWIRFSSLWTRRIALPTSGMENTLGPWSQNFMWLDCHYRWPTESVSVRRLDFQLNISCCEVLGYMLRQIRSDRYLDNCRFNSFYQWQKCSVSESTLLLHFFSML